MKLEVKYDEGPTGRASVQVDGNVRYDIASLVLDADQTEGPILYMTRVSLDGDGSDRLEKQFSVTNLTLTCDIERVDNLDNGN